MTTATRYNHTAKLFANGEVDLTTLKLMLTDDGVSFDGSHTTLEQIVGAGHENEVHGSGWTEGGEDLANATVTIVTTNEAKLDADPITVQATGGSIGPAHNAVIYYIDNTVSPPVNIPLALIDFEGAQEAGEGTDFKYTPHADGIIRWTNPA